MTLIKSISGIRGTIGGRTGENLTPVDAVKFAAAYGAWLKNDRNKETYRVVVGRDARISGSMIQELVMNTLVGMGIHIIDLGLSTTPTVEVAVPMEHADGGIILTASHNPKQWNALKLLNSKGEFLNGVEGEKILNYADNEDFTFAEVDDLGKITKNDAYIDLHIEEVKNLELVDVNAIKDAKFKVVVDGVNSTGGIAIPRLLEELGVEAVKLYCTPNGEFPHNPEPLKEHLGDICKMVVDENADFGIVVDPDVDRLAFIDDKGEMFGEEYTLVACADYVLGETKGNTVSNLSSSRALRDITRKHGGEYFASAVGEVNVVQTMKDQNAVIELKASYPPYFMSKQKIQLTPGLDVDALLEKMAAKYANEDVSTVDGVKVDFENHWVHLRKSNTEPIIRIYTEASTQAEADQVANDMIATIKEVAGI